MAEVPAEKIGRYQVLEVLGKGAMGVVYRAEDPTIGRQVALKTTRLDVAGMENEETLRRFRQEARAAGTLNHPNIVTIYDAGEQAGLFYIAMELIRGVTLQSLLADHKVLETDQVVEILRQVCAGLDYAHQHGIIHRDVKPANIMITPEGLVKIMDFGIAKYGAGMTTAGQVLGTPSYMSPEQVRGATLDGRSDLFSVGVILYECATGQKPFKGENVTTIVYQIIAEEPRPARTLNAKLHPRFDAVIARAMAKNQGQRYQTGAELARDLATCRTEAKVPGDSTSEFPESPPSLATVITGSRSSAPPATASSTPALGTGATFSTGSTTAPAVVGSGALAKPAAGGPYGRPAPGVAAVPSPAPVAASPSGTTKQVAVAARKTPLAMLGAVAGLLVVLAAGGFWLRHQQQARRAAAEAQAPPVAASQPAATQPAAAASSAPAAPATSEPAPAMAEPALVNILFQSTPKGATVLMGGKVIGTTPFRKALKPQSYSFAYRLAGYVDRTVAQAITADSKSVQVTLQSNQATVQVVSQPAGAAIFVDDKDSGKVTPADVTVEAGAHTFRLQKAGYRAVSTPLTLSAGEKHTLAPGDLQKESGNVFARLGKAMGGGDKDKALLSADSLPSGAEVLLDGSTVGKTPVERREVKPGTHQLTFKKTNCETVTRSITLEAGKPFITSEPLTCKK